MRAREFRFAALGGESGQRAIRKSMNDIGGTIMKIGFSAPTAGPLSALDPLVRLCVGAEEMGFDYGTFSDHVVIPTEISSPYPYSATGEFTNQGTGERNEQLIELAFVAARTTN